MSSNQINAIPSKGKVTWIAPSNIAIVKYWGKQALQEPINPSLSLTLNNAKTTTTVEFERISNNKSAQIKLWFNGAEKPEFLPKINRFIEQLTPFFPSIKNYYFTIHTSNSFPHSAGIASSASSMSAFALCLLSISNIIKGESPYPDLKTASTLARLGSGSACRSVFGGWNLWGEHTQIAESSNAYAINLNHQIHSNFMDVKDAILIISSDEKSVGSSAGHELMTNHWFKQSRIDMAIENTSNLINALSVGDWEQFIAITEHEALTLHGLMMSSNSGYLLLKPNTLLAIEAIRRYRLETGANIAFTLDAGPNLHILYPNKESEKIEVWINSHLRPLCENQFILFDSQGNGPELINYSHNNQ